MTLFMGQEAEGGGTSISIPAENAGAFNVTALATGALQSISALYVTLVASSLRMALWTEGVGKPGATIVEAEIGETKAGVNTVSLTGTVLGTMEPPVISGVKYWIVVETPNAAGKIKQATVPTTLYSKSKTKHPLISETTEWTTAETLGPSGVYGSGEVAASGARTTMLA